MISLGVALYHGEFAAVSAVMEHHGVPIDMEIFQQLADKDVWRAVRDEMVPASTRSTASMSGATTVPTGSSSSEIWIAYLEREGIYDAWPRLASGALDMRRKTFEDMTKGFPQLEALRQLRHARDKMRRIKLAVGHDARNRTVLWPFKSKTGRTQPKASTWIFSPAVWLRSLIKPEPGMAVAYVDYSSMEFLIAASLSDGHCGPVNNMLDMYRTGDPYLSFAKSVGAVPQSATKKSHADGARPLQDHAAVDAVRPFGGRRWRRGSTSRHSTPTRCSASTASNSHNTGPGRMTTSTTRCRPALVRTALRLDLSHRDRGGGQRPLDP